MHAQKIVCDWFGSATGQRSYGDFSLTAETQSSRWDFENRSKNALFQKKLGFTMPFY